MIQDTRPSGARVSQRAPAASSAVSQGDAGALFHEGERALQQRAGVEQVAAQIGRNIVPFVPVGFSAFLSRQPFVVVASRDQSGRAWASVIAGQAGFARALDDRHVLLASLPASPDPLEAALGRRHAQVGLLAIEPDTRQRIRINGTAQRVSDGILLTVAEAYANCPKYIQRRQPTERLTVSAASAHHESTMLDARHAALVRGADTFFIASAHPLRGADASHRGGRPGFVRVSGRRQLIFPDYSGNRMFQTLGNLTVNPRIGLLFVDWETGSTLQLTGQAKISWDEAAVRAWPGAERLVEVRLDAVREHDRAIPDRWTMVEPHPRNPPLGP